MTDMLEQYRQKVVGTNIDQRSLLSTDYFNHFNSVIMLFGMLPDAPELLEDIDSWEFLGYIDHFKTSNLDFSQLAIEAYEYAPQNLREQFNRKSEEIRIFIEVSRLGLRRLIESGDKDRFADMALRVSRELQLMVDAGGAIVHGNDGAMNQSAIDKMFNAWGEA